MGGKARAESVDDKGARCSTRVMQTNQTPKCHEARNQMVAVNRVNQRSYVCSGQGVKAELNYSRLTTCQKWVNHNESLKCNTQGPNKPTASAKSDIKSNRLSMLLSGEARAVSCDNRAVRFSTRNIIQTPKRHGTH